MTSPEIFRRMNPQLHAIGRALTPRGWSDPPRVGHDSWFTAVGSGGEMEVEAGRRIILLGPGEGLLLGPGTVHARKLTRGHSVYRYWLNFHWTTEIAPPESVQYSYAPDAREERWPQYPLPGWLPPDLCSRPIPLPSGFDDQFLEMNERFWHADGARLACTRGLLLQMLTEWLGALFSWPQAETRPEPESGVGNLLTILRQVAEQPFNRSLSVQAALGKTGLSYAHQARLFQRERGVTPLQYVNRLRLHRARRLLRATDLSVSAIARELGFGDCRYFVKWFRRLAGCDPAAWRARSRRDFRGSGA